MVKECVARGHEVWYYSFDEFKERIEGAGAKFISCDSYLPPTPKHLEKRVGRDFSLLISMLADMTVSLAENVLDDLQTFQPDCIVSDSMCLWGKLFAQKLNIPYICSTTTFAFNRETAKIMKSSFSELLWMVRGMPVINRKIRMLQDHGYAVEHLLDIIENKNDTDTIVYTSKEFQPMADTFSERFAFVGPSISAREAAKMDKVRPLIYISLGTVMNQATHFYQACFEALKDQDLDVIMAVGNRTDIKELGTIPANFTVEHYADQIAILQHADVFLTHCGMNSANEAIYFSVPTVLYPQQSEERAVAMRMEQLRLGIRLRKPGPKQIREAVKRLLADASYRENNRVISASFAAAGGYVRAADKIEQKMRQSGKI